MVNKNIPINLYIVYNMVGYMVIVYNIV